VDIEPRLITKDVREILSDPEIDIVIELLAASIRLWISSRSPAGWQACSHGQQGSGGQTRGGVAGHGQGQRRALQFEAKRGRRHTAASATAARTPGQRDLNHIRHHQRHDQLHPHQDVPERVGFSDALKKAQELAYAEADPSNDVEGRDATYKLAIMASGRLPHHGPPGAGLCEGISRLAEPDFRYAKELGYEIKLLAIAKQAWRRC